MSLRLAHPEIPSCRDCQEWWYDPKSWKITERPIGTPLKRQTFNPPPCSQCPKIPKGAEPIPSNAVELSAKNWLAYRLWKQIKAGAPMPNDAVVHENCGYLLDVEESYQRGQQGQSAVLLQVLTAATAVRTKR